MQSKFFVSHWKDPSAASGCLAASFFCRSAISGVHTSSYLVLCLCRHTFSAFPEKSMQKRCWTRGTCRRLQRQASPVLLILLFPTAPLGSHGSPAKWSFQGDFKKGNPFFGVLFRSAAAPFPHAGKESGVEIAPWMAATGLPHRQQPENRIQPDGTKHHSTIIIAPLHGFCKKLSRILHSARRPAAARGKKRSRCLNIS